eukprot:scaffold53857_cov21-Tisochrysis_lutea.AAC.1
MITHNIVRVPPPPQVCPDHSHYTPVYFLGNYDPKAKRFYMSTASVEHSHISSGGTSIEPFVLCGWNQALTHWIWAADPKDVLFTHPTCSLTTLMLGLGKVYGSESLIQAVLAQQQAMRFDHEPSCKLGTPCCSLHLSLPAGRL